MARTGALARSIARLAEAERDGGERYVDLCLVVKVGIYQGRGDTCRLVGDGPEVCRVGGRWDRRRRRFAGAAKTGRIVHVHPGQVKAAKWFARWLRCRASGDWSGFWRVWSTFLVGGRRSGKSHFAVLALVLFAVMAHGARVWAISPAQEQTEELEVALKSIMPRSWYKYRGDPKFEFRLQNGSRIRLLSGHKPSSLKRGRVDLVLYNEGQLMSHKGYLMLRGAVPDTAGMVIVAANPPDAPIGLWVDEQLDKIREQAGLPDEQRTVESQLFEMDPRDNPWIEYSALLSIQHETDWKSYQREVLGLSVGIGDFVFYNWTRGPNGNERPLPTVGDITHRWIKRELGRDVDAVVGLDFQVHPYLAAAGLKLYHNAAAPSKPLVWYDDYHVVPDDEVALSELLEAVGYSKERTLLVLDASAWWQDAEHTKGKASEKILRGLGWKHIVRPDRKMKRNPPIAERIKAAATLIQPVQMVNEKPVKRPPRLFCDPRLKELIEVFRKWEVKPNGIPKHGKHSHLGDAATYPIWLLFPRRIRRARFQVDRGRLERGARENDLRDL